jgi:hypothetical protein
MDHDPVELSHRSDRAARGISVTDRVRRFATAHGARLGGTVVLLASLGGCLPATKAAPVAQRVAIAGDSLIIQASVYGGDLHGADIDRKVGLGWTAVKAQPRVSSDVAGAHTAPSVLVVAFGQNYGPRYGAPERSELFSMVFTPHETTCVVLVLPHPGKPWNTTHHRNVASVRQTLLDLAAARPNTVVVDWSPEVQAHPEYLADDAIHLDVSADADADGRRDAAVAYGRLVWSGVEQCPGMS